MLLSYENIKREVRERAAKLLVGAPAVTILFALTAAIPGMGSELEARPRPSTPGGLAFPEWARNNDFGDLPTSKEFSLINYFLARATHTNVFPNNPVALPGTALGPYGSPNGHQPSTGKLNKEGTASEQFRNTFAEQRWIPILTYTPNFFDGKASFRVKFEVDYVYGNGQNTLGENRGGGLNADQVNIQTKAVYMHWDINPRLALSLGTQDFYDSVWDPFRDRATDILRTGYKLTVFGTDATGIAFYGKYFGRQKIAYIPASAGREDTKKDDIQLFTVDHAFDLGPGTRLGFSLYYLRDDSRGNHSLYPLVPEKGPASPLHMGFTGTQPFNISNPKGRMAWAGMNFNHNIDFHTSRFGMSGFLIYSQGRHDNDNTTKFTTAAGQTLNDVATDPGGTNVWKVDTRGYAANLEFMYNYGKTAGYETGDYMTLEFLYTSGDNDPTDQEYGGIFTMNYYGLPGATWISHKMLLLFPFGQAIGHFTGAMTDISNRGLGVSAAMFALYYDIIPHKLNVKLGLGYARANYSPLASQEYASYLNNGADIETNADFTNFKAQTAGLLVDRADNLYREYAGREMGREVNVEIKYHIRYLMTIGLHVAKMKLGSFYETEIDPVTFRRKRPVTVGRDPWAAYVTFTWIGF